MPCIMIVLDGLEDREYPVLGGKTPYDWGKGANFGRIESACARGRLKTTPDGFEADTQACILTMLGVAPRDIPGGRSYIEARALGIPVRENDIVMRCNFVKIAPDGTLEDPTCCAPHDIAEALKAAVAARPGHSITQVGPYKNLQVVSDGGEYADMVTFPPHNHAGEPFERLLPSGNALADSLAEFSREQLRAYKPYTVLNWSQATPCVLPAFSALHGGMTGGMVSATHAPMGVAVAMGMACPALPTATGDTDTDLAAKAEATLELLSTCDFVMLHIGGPDEATHRKNAPEKAEFVRRLDAELLMPIMERCPDNTRIMVTCDHVALCETGGHTEEPVEFMLWQKSGKLSGDLGVIDGKMAVEVLAGE